MFSPAGTRKKALSQRSTLPDAPVDVNKFSRGHGADTQICPCVFLGIPKVQTWSGYKARGSIYVATAHIAQTYTDETRVRRAVLFIFLSGGAPASSGPPEHARNKQERAYKWYGPL